MPKKALLTGISGQDGSYLAELLLEKGYEVHGIVRRLSSTYRPRLDAVQARRDLPLDMLHLHYGDLADGGGLVRLVDKVQPDEVYNLAAQSHVRVSFDTPEYTSDVTGTGCIRLLEAIRDVGIKPRFYQASSSEMYGKVHAVPQTEDTPFHPRSPYAVAKVFAFWADGGASTVLSALTSGGWKPFVTLAGHDDPNVVAAAIADGSLFGSAGIGGGPGDVVW